MDCCGNGPVAERPFFFDFGEESALWWLFSPRTDAWLHVARFSRTEFVDIHRRGAEKIDEFAKFLMDMPNLISSYYSARGTRMAGPLGLPPPRGRTLQSTGFQQFLAKRGRSRRRL